ncbi:uncharacterized protein PV06_00041 [Exophiala oligosperma]|uniref:Uncharacterized protein n=1 Tax=Exophiala oligosperma TaxID=215243 RepID=A0A0D2EHA2_9EURO|nr:uncharacterized protein PV06_00041 [Exophiala oligosperma]KIW47339.1 hypothetical protein PV06_00041 [Exophiala oligosperma]
MTFLSRKGSGDSTDRDNDGRGRSRASSTETDQGSSKPSIFRRLSKSISRSDEGPKKKDDPSNTTQQHEAKTSQKQATMESMEKLVEPKVDELRPETTAHDVHVERMESHPHPSANIASSGSPPSTPRSATDTHRLPTHDSGIVSRTATKQEPSKKPDGLTKDDVEHLFNGAPQFILEKGRRGRFFPQAFFPWNNDLEVGDLQDRRYLKHESFAFCTLHAHLPIPDEVGWVPGMPFPMKKVGLETGKRPLFELGIYERPNMLGQDGREPGTVGLRYFLERPVADGVQDSKIREHAKDVEVDLSLDDTPATEAFKMLALSRDNEQMNAKVGKHAPAQDRLKFINGGPPAWKSVGVRPITMQCLVGRMEMLDGWRDRTVSAGWRATVLDQVKSPELHDHLFGELLYPPRKLHNESKWHDKEAMKVQIEALVKVLATPGAWLDLSAPEARLRFGKIINSRTTHFDYTTGTMIINPERKWLLIQLLLSLELVVRLDAALRLGIAMHAEHFEISSEEIHHFNKLRTLKVDWDLVLARRYLDLCYVKRNERKETLIKTESQAHKLDRHASFFGGLRHTLGLDDRAESEPDLCDVAILPRDPQIIIDGVFRFATNIGWPRALDVQARLSQKLNEGTQEDRDRFLLEAFFCTNETHHAQHEAELKIVPPLDSFNLNLHAATPETIGGWLSHSWFSGLILPGNSTSDMLMATLLENDTDPATLETLGTMNLPFRSCGFVLGDSSWWSKSSIVARVLAPIRGSKESMGWICLPNFVPFVESTSEAVSSRWLKIKSYPVPTQRDRPRILDGDRLATESTPLGVGKGGIMGAEFSMVTDHILDHDSHAEVVVKSVSLHLSNTNATAMSADHALSAWAQFDLSITRPDGTPPEAKQVRYGLDRAVYYVTAYPCRLPHGHATFKPGSTDAHYIRQHPRHKASEHLPAHPLHKTYRFVTKTLEEVVENPHLEPPACGAGPTVEVWIVDARNKLSAGEKEKWSEIQSLLHQSHNQNQTRSDDTSSTTSSHMSAAASLAEWCGPGVEQIRNKDVLVRAWCAQKGRNAIVARVGRTCLSCAVREAKALEIGVIVRVGIKE